MTDNQLKNILLELASASKSIKNEDDLRNAMNNYDMLFCGNNYNQINSLELRHSLSQKFNIDVTNEHLNSLIPEVCSTLGIHITKLIAADNSENTSPYCYEITLW